MMKTILEDVSPVKKKLVIEIDAEEVDKKVDAAYKKFGKKAKIKGFRPGKIPRKVLENYYGEQVLEDVTRTLINETLPKAMEESETFPLDMPVVENEILKKGQNYRYSAVMEVRPEFELKGYKGLEVEKEICTVTEEDVERRLKEIRESSGSLVAVNEDRGIKEDDFAIIDYEGFDGDTPIEEVKSQNFSLKIGSKQFYPGIEDAIIGSKKGDAIEIEVAFEEDYFHSKLAGKSVKFKIKVVDIKEMELPELDDDFAKNLGGDFKGLDDLKEKIEESLKKSEEKRVDQELKERLLEKISDSVDFDLPECLVEPEINGAVENIKQNLARSGADLEKSGFDETKLREELRPASEKRVKGMLILGEVAKENDLNVGEEDLSEGFNMMAEGMGQSPQVLRQYYEGNNLIDSFRQSLLKEKALNYLVESAKVNKVNADKINDE